MENYKEKTIDKITVKEAIRKTKNWRHFIKKFLKAKHSKSLPKGVYISKEDIEGLSQLCHSDEHIKGVRAYFTLENHHEELPYDNLVKFIMVPVRHSAEHSHGRDDLYALSPNDDNLDDSNIYDFTRPCPDCCDPTSELYGIQE